MKSKAEFEKEGVDLHMMEDWWNVTFNEQLNEVIFNYFCLKKAGYTLTIVLYEKSFNQKLEQILGYLLQL